MPWLARESRENPGIIKVVCEDPNSPGYGMIINPATDIAYLDFPLNPLDQIGSGAPTPAAKSAISAIVRLNLKFEKKDRQLDLIRPMVRFKLENFKENFPKIIGLIDPEGKNNLKNALKEVGIDFEAVKKPHRPPNVDVDAEPMPPSILRTPSSRASSTSEGRPITFSDVHPVSFKKEDPQSGLQPLPREPLIGSPKPKPTRTKRKI